MPNEMPKKENFKPKGKKNFGKRKFSKDPSSKEGPGEFPKPGNDVSWYRLNADVADVVGRLPFAKPLGLALYDDHTDSKTGYRIMASRVPGIMSIVLEPRVPANNGNYLNLGVVAQNIYSWIRHANSGHANYDPIDLLIYMLAVGECYSYLGWMWGLYTRVCLAAAENRYYGRALIKASGGDYDDLIAHRNDFFAYINLFADRLQTLAVPAKMPFFMKKFSQYLSIYSDREGWKGQIYVFRPKGFMTFDVLETTGGSLYWEDSFAKEGADFTNIRSVGEGMLNALLQDEDAGIMSGDVIKATRERGGIFTLPRLIEGTAAQPVVNVDILSQIHNLKISHPLSSSNWGSTAYRQLNGVLDVMPATYTGANAQAVKTELRGTNALATQLLDAFEENPSSDRVLEMTRLTAVDDYTFIRTGDNAYTLIIKPNTCDVFACVKLQVYCYVNDGSIGVSGIDYMTGSDVICGDIVPFDYGPLLYFYKDMVVSDSGVSCDVVTYIYSNDIINPITVDLGYLRDVNFVIVNSLFAVPALKHLS